MNTVKTTQGDKSLNGRGPQKYPTRREKRGLWGTSSGNLRSPAIDTRTQTAEP